jgi:hypothetical protein
VSIAGLIVTAIIAIIALAWITYPLLLRQRDFGESARQQRQRDELLTTYERVIATIRDLDEDFRTGKMNEEDYAPERERWSARGVEILRQLQNAGGLPATQLEQSADEAAVDDAIEDAVASYIAAMKEQPPPE